MVNISWFFFSSNPTSLVHAMYQLYRKMKLGGEIKNREKVDAAYAAEGFVTRKFFKTQNSWLINKSVFKSRAGYNGARTVFSFNPSFLNP